MALDTVTGALIGGAVSLIGGLFGGGKARKRARAAAKEKKRLEILIHQSAAP